MGNQHGKGPKHSKSTKMVPCADFFDKDFAIEDNIISTSSKKGGAAKFDTTDIINYLENPETHSKRFPDLVSSQITLELWGNREQDKKFMALASKHQFPEIHKLQVKMVSDMKKHHELKDFNNMMRKSFKEPMKYLHLGGGHYADLGPLKKGLKNIIPLVTDQIYLVSFNIDGRTLSKIFEYARNVRSLVLCDCKIDLSSEFQLDPDIEFSIKELDLYCTLDKKDHDKLDLEKTQELVGELAKTDLVKSLKHIHVHDCSFPGAQVQQIFHQHGFKVSVKSNDHYPENLED